MVIGITGSFGTGKTTVANMFKQLGANVIDADRLTHRLYEAGSRTHHKIIRSFGREIIYARTKRINRRKLAEIVFKDASSLKKLCAIIHPAVIKEIKKRIKKAKDKVNILDAPLLIEARLLDLVDKLIVVVANQRNQIKRIKKNFSITQSEILDRIKAQIPLRKKISLADFVIDNNGGLRETEKQVKEIWHHIKKGTGNFFEANKK